MLFFKYNDKDNNQDGQDYCCYYINNNGSVVIWIVWWCVNLCNKE